MDVALCTTPTCSNPTHGHDRVCESCVARVRHRLRLLPELLGELLITMTRQDAVSDPSMGAGAGGEHPLVFRPHASDTARDVQAAIEAVVDRVAPEWGTTLADLRGARPDIRTLPAGAHGPDRPPIPGMRTYGHRNPQDTRVARFPDADTIELGRWLEVRAGTLADVPRGGALVDQLDDAIDRAWWAVDRPDQARRYLGRCACNGAGAEDQGLTLRSAELWARDDATAVSCRVCGTVYGVDDRRRELLKMAESLYVTAELASRALPVLLSTSVDLTPAVIEGWRRRHGLTAYKAAKKDPHHRLRYRVGDLLDQIAAARERTYRRTIGEAEDDLPDGLRELFQAVRRNGGLGRPT